MNFQNLEPYLKANAGPFVVRLVTAIAVGLFVLIAAKVIGRVMTKALCARSGRTRTIAPLLSGLVSVVGVFVAVVMSLAQLGIDVTTVLAGAGVVGLAIGFGAQTLVKDCITGFFLILDDVVEVGDRIEVDGKKGVVERVGLRVTQVRSDSGQLWYIPNGTIGSVGNLNRGYNRAIVEVTIPNDIEISDALGTLERVGASWAERQPELALEAPRAEGVVGFGDKTVTVRLSAKVPAGRAQEAEMDLRRRVKVAMDERRRFVEQSERKTAQGDAPRPVESRRRWY